LEVSDNSTSTPFSANQHREFIEQIISSLNRTRKIDVWLNVRNSGLSAVIQWMPVFLSLEEERVVMFLNLLVLDTKAIFWLLCQAAEKRSSLVFLQMGAVNDRTRKISVRYEA
jgi:hypothetical protein